MREYKVIHHPKNSYKKAHSSPKSSSVERLGQRRTTGSSPFGPMTRKRSSVMLPSPKIEIRHKKSHKHLAPAEPEERRAKKKLKAAPSVVFPPFTAALLVTVPPAPTPSVPASKDKGKAPTIPPVRRTPRFATAGKLKAKAMRTAHVLNTRQHFPEANFEGENCPNNFKKKMATDHSSLGLRSLHKSFL